MITPELIAVVLIALVVLAIGKRSHDGALAAETGSGCASFLGMAVMIILAALLLAAVYSIRGSGL